MAELVKKLFLLDAYALIYRAHFAFTKNPRINSKGRNTSVPFGFTNTLLEVIQKQKPSHIGVAFDTAAKTFRDEIFKEYKANRQETPEDIRYGIPIVKDIIRGFNIPILELDGYEADDLIGTLALKANEKGFEVFMMTPDKDFGQIVREKVWLYKPAYMGNSVDILGPKEVCEKWDISDVSQVVDMLGLQGDTSDNIPGIPGFGPKTAAELLKVYGTVEGIIAHASELKGKKRELVEQHAEQALLSKKLAAINIESPIEFSEEALVYKGPNIGALKPIFEEMEFKSILARLESGVGAGADSPAPAPAQKKQAQLSMFDAPSNEITEPIKVNRATNQYQRCETQTQRVAIAEKLAQQKMIGIETVLEGDSAFDSKLIGVALSWVAGEAAFVSVADKQDAAALLAPFKRILGDNQISKTGHNLKHSVMVFRKLGLPLGGKLFDSLLGHYLIEPEASHDMAVLSTQFAGFTMMEKDRAEHERMCERADIGLQIRSAMQYELETRGHSRLMDRIEMPLAHVLADMEFEGVNLDVPFLSKMSDELKIISDEVQKEIFKLAGMEFNLNSPKQLGDVLFDKLELVDKAKKTKTGQYATGEEVLMKLANEHPIAKKILDFRELDKLRSTYVDALPRMISREDGRVHTDYRQAVAATGRLSSNNPNLQNIPIRTEKGKQIRRAFIPRSQDFLFMSADYSQIELRIAAAFAKDQTMIDAFKNKRDIHTTTAAKVFKTPIESVTPDMRRKAKEVNFGILYGSTAFGLAQNLNISRTEAAELIESYFKEFPGIKRFMDDSINQARETEFVETILGRRRYLRDINSRNITTRGFAERNAINAPIQGSAADIIKIAMLHIHSWLTKEKLKTKMILQVHDELVFDLHKDEVDIVKPKVIELMRNAVQLEVPMDVEVGVGENWLEAH
jgi:DNA polymerase I